MTMSDYVPKQVNHLILWWVGDAPTEIFFFVKKKTIFRGFSAVFVTNHSHCEMSFMIFIVDNQPPNKDTQWIAHILDL